MDKYCIAASCQLSYLNSIIQLLTLSFSNYAYNLFAKVFVLILLSKKQKMLLLLKKRQDVFAKSMIQGLRLLNLRITALIIKLKHLDNSILAEPTKIS